MYPLVMTLTLTTDQERWDRRAHPAHHWRLLKWSEESDITSCLPSSLHSTFPLLDNAIDFTIKYSIVQSNCRLFDKRISIDTKYVCRTVHYEKFIICHNSFWPRWVDGEGAGCHHDSLQILRDRAERGNNTAQGASYIYLEKFNVIMAGSARCNEDVGPQSYGARNNRSDK